MIKKISILMFALVMFAACSSLSEDDQGGHGTGKALKNFTKGDVALPTVVFPEKSISSRLKKAYGKPLEIVEEKKKNVQAPDYEDTFLTWIYKDVSYTIYISGYNGDESLLSVTISGKNIKLDNKLRIGLNRGTVYTLLGFPFTEDDISMIFYIQDVNGPMTWEYYLTMEDNIVSEIQISGYGI